ncbi:hypothetical protein F5J12DRAFT_893785 [Pisolithus orientalis]|uniref:uncharacterized protein n=1 Tax=Pisolithus orientalis TaxID=936130 RepID=UPI00222437A6|nr:uncharacterized protein F5J12DRAFT_893785 [Pisolithus orientalis]KAI6003539.1 hypothetical protein F5J12DRAFT_893785 [Pisolithus orientalis]
MSISPGLYRITTHLSPNPAIGVNPYIRSGIKPVIVAPPQFSPDGTTWEVVQEEDGQFYLLVVNSANIRPEEDKVFAFYNGVQGERWKIVHHPLRRGYVILSADESLAWHLPNAEYETQVELKALGILPGEGYYFNLERLVE